MTIHYDFDNFSDINCEMTQINSLFPNAKFVISLSVNELNKIITTKKEVKLIQTFDCYCFDNCPKQNKTFIIRSEEPMTTKYIINELIKKDFTLDCNHRFLESIEIKDDIIEYWTGS